MECKSVIGVLLVSLISISGAFTGQCNGGARCVSLEVCDGLYKLVQTPHVSPQIAQYLRSLHCGFGNGQPYVCCQPQYMADDGFDPISLLPDNSTCGFQETSDRIVGGKITGLDEHPWSALLRYDKPDGTWGFYCGGVLISSKYVLTAAHCVKGQDLPPTWSLTKVRLGEHDILSYKDCMGKDVFDENGNKRNCNDPVEDVKVQEIIAHNQYYPADDNQHNDIALLRLAYSVRYTAFIKPICLPLQQSERSSNFINKEMEVAGWGKTESKSESNLKLKVQLPLVSPQECGNVFKRVGRIIAPTQICAGGVQGKDSCRGDSGGSLMLSHEKSALWFAVGVVSYGPTPCGTPGWPGVYTRVGAYVDWILSNIKP